MNYKIKNFIQNELFKTEIGLKVYSLIAGIVRSKRQNMTDEEYVKNSFRENNGIDLNLDSPKTFNEKLLWLSLHDRNPLKTRCADKYLVRDYIEECGFHDILNEVYGVFENVDDIDLSKMPEKFFIKTNHDSGTYALINKSKADEIPKAFEKIRKSLKRNYYYESREWQYKDIKPLAICEKYIETDDPLGLVDYRFFCFNGEIGFIAVDIGTTDASGKHAMFARRNIYDADFKYLDAKMKREGFDKNLIKKPKNFERMKDIAKKLSNPFKHVRVDFYNTNGKIIFGELTFCTGGGIQLLEPDDFNMRIGDLIDIGDVVDNHW